MALSLNNKFEVIVGVVKNWRFATVTSVNLILYNPLLIKPSKVLTSGSMYVLKLISN